MSAIKILIKMGVFSLVGLLSVLVGLFTQSQPNGTDKNGGFSIKGSFSPKVASADVPGMTESEGNVGCTSGGCGK